MVITREELKNSPALRGEDSGRIRIDFNEVLIIVAALLVLGAGLVTGRLSETSFGTLIGSFFGYTFGRIFNHVQGKE